MTTEQMRVELEKKYNKAFVDSKSDAQVQAIYFRLKGEGKI
jgi:hypothetical protein